MTRLIVEEQGAQRAFKVNDGRMSIGSSPEATLRLSAGGVADVHADIDVQGGRVRLCPRLGVVPPLVGGVPAMNDVELPHGAVVTIGEATLRFQYDHVPPPRKPPVRGAGGGSPTAFTPQPAEGSQQLAKPRGASLPFWLVVLLVVVAALVVWIAAARIASGAPAAAPNSAPSR